MNGGEVIKSIRTKPLCKLSQTTSSDSILLKLCIQIGVISSRIDRGVLGLLLARTHALKLSFSFLWPLGRVAEKTKILIDLYKLILALAELTLYGINR